MDATPPIDIELLRQICELPGAPGFEERIRAFVVERATPLVDAVRVDNMGNVVALRKGREPVAVLAAAHMDEIGFLVTHIDDDGFLRFQPLGGFDPKTLTAQRVIVHGRRDVVGVMGSKPIHIMTPEEKEKPARLDDYYIDLGLPKDEVEQVVAIGDPVTRERGLIEMGACVNCKSLDNRVCVFVLLEALRLLREVELPYDFHAAFTVQEEVGLRGATVASLDVRPRFSFGLDTTLAYDVPGAKPHERVTQLGKGVAVKIMDASVICDSRMVSFMKEVAGSEGIPWQPEILRAGGTDTASLQRMTPGGSIAGAISVPTRHIHQVIEMSHRADIDAAVKLLAACVRRLPEGSWEW